MCRSFHPADKERHMDESTAIAKGDLDPVLDFDLDCDLDRCSPQDRRLHAWRARCGGRLWMRGLA
jgi:hypothetical protein